VNEETASCPAYDAIQVLQEKWVLHIVRTLLDGPRGFNELGREVGGCNPTTLTQRLVLLEGMKLVHKNIQSRAPLRCTYELSPAGRALEDVVAAIDDWARNYMADCRCHAENQAADADGTQRGRQAASRPETPSRPLQAAANAD